MDEPVDYRKMGAHLAATRHYNSVEISTDYHSTWLNNAKAKFLLDWRPQYDLERLIDEAFNYERAETDPREVWYPG
jgi:nucleoside-diphosphate-sugar epimerase